MTPAIGNFAAADSEDWLRLWDANNGGRADRAVAAETWRRLLDPASPVHGLAAREGDKMVGFVHYILHPVTGHVQPAAYMQDLYVDPAFRRRGIGRALVGALAERGKAEGWARLYWLAEENNEGARALYRGLGVKLAFSLYVLPLRAS